MGLGVALCVVITTMEAILPQPTPGKFIQRRSLLDMRASNGSMIPAAIVTINLSRTGKSPGLGGVGTRIELFRVTAHTVVTNKALWLGIAGGILI